MYQEIFFDVQPEFILETGSYKGGSALYMAHLCDLLGKGEIVSIDIEQHERPRHPRITYITDSSRNAALIADIFRNRSGRERTLVVLDSDHSEEHVSVELELLSPYVSVGSYLIVEDTNLNGHPTYESHGPGPFEAVEKFLQAHTNFEIDRARERFLMTFNPNGYLRKLR